MKTAKEIAGLLANQADDIAKMLLPNGKAVGKEWVTGNLQDEKGDSLKVCISGTKKGVWKDFATGQAGDLLNLWALVNHCSVSEALKQATHYLGMALPSFEPLKQKKWNKPKLTGKLSINTSSAVENYLLQQRKLNRGTIEAFKIHERQINSKWEIVFPFYRESDLIFVKYLGLERDVENGKPKKVIYSDKDLEPILFGWQTIPPLTRTVTICEGEIDAMTLWQYGIPALSIPGGVENDKWIAQEYDRLAIFDEIYLCFDNDEAGQKGMQKIVDRLGRVRCRIVKLPRKDANECLQFGIGSEEIKLCFDKAKSCDPDELAQASQFYDEVVDEFYGDKKDIGISPPWKKTHGSIVFRPSELSIWSGINGHGKTQFLGQIILHAIKNNKRVCIASLEIKPRRLLYRLARQAAGLAQPTKEYLKAIFEWYHDKLFIFNFVGTVDKERLLDVFTYARLKHGVDIFAVDSLMMLDVAEDDYKKQKEFINQICKFKEQHNCHVMLVAHPRKGANEEEPPKKLDVKGSGCITDLADSCFTVWRNKKKEKTIAISEAKQEPLSDAELKKPDCIWYCDKQRFGDWEGEFYFWFDKNSFQYLSSYDAKPIQYVQFSNLTIQGQKK